METVTLVQGFEVGLKTLRSFIANIRSNVLKSEEVDKKTLAVVSRLVELLEKTESALDALAKKLEGGERGFVELSSYFYVFKAGGDVILLRTRPEHIVISINLENKTVTIKTRKGSISVASNGFSARARGISLEITPATPEGFIERRDELRAVLGVLEKSIYRRLISYIEQKTIRK
ncbi:MAG: hypothetical protein LM589_04895 [Thermosphaera sp.]|nr:hypothetical protein [Thermosphaera sp.]